MGELPREELIWDMDTEFVWGSSFLPLPQLQDGLTGCSQQRKSPEGENPRRREPTGKRVEFTVNRATEWKLQGVWSLEGLGCHLKSCSHSLWALEYLFLRLWSGRGCLSYAVGVRTAFGRTEIPGTLHLLLRNCCSSRMGKMRLEECEDLPQLRG